MRDYFCFTILSGDYCHLSMYSVFCTAGCFVYWALEILLINFLTEIINLEHLQQGLYCNRMQHILASETQHCWWSVSFKFWRKPVYHTKVFQQPPLAYIPTQKDIRRKMEYSSLLEYIHCNSVALLSDNKHTLSPVRCSPQIYWRCRQ
jgi:hypothetical protein